MMTKRLASRLRAFSACRNGATAVEFAALSPVLILLIGGIVDIGGALEARGSMDASLSASVQYVLANADKASMASGNDLAAKALVVAADGLDRASGTANASINGRLAASLANGVVTMSKPDSRFDQCFCPSVTTQGVSWGPQSTCASPCADGGYAGKFVSIEMGQRANPLFKGVIDENGMISTRMAVQVQ